MKDIVEGKANVVAGSRREADSVSLIGGSRNQRGLLFISIWKYFLPQLAEIITDTNRAFKAFEHTTLEKILPMIETYTFAYQVEMLQACISSGFSLTKKGIAYVDSEAASTQNTEDITDSYLNQVHQIIDIAQRFNTISKQDKWLNYFLNISEEEWLKIETNPPKELLNLQNSI